MLYLITGGSGSGKSEYAENIAKELYNRLSAENLIYAATMKPYGEIAQKRIKRHRALREGKGFKTVECYYNLQNLTVDSNSVVLLECISNLTANEMFERDNKNAVYDTVKAVNQLTESCMAVVAVTNEVFSDGIEYPKETGDYIRALGEINCRLAQRADLVTEVVCGIPISIKGGESNAV